MLRSVSGICYYTLCDLIPLYNGMISVPSRLAAVPVRWVYLKPLSPFLFFFFTADAFNRATYFAFNHVRYSGRQYSCGPLIRVLSLTLREHYGPWHWHLVVQEQKDYRKDVALYSVLYSFDDIMQ